MNENAHQNEREQNTASNPDAAAALAYDQSRRAQQVLDYVLKDEVAAASGASTDLGVPVDAALHEAPVAEIDSMRATSRVLFVTGDAAALTSGSTLQESYRALARVFDEVHVLVLIPRKGTTKSTRIDQRAWTYAVYSPHWWKLPFAARSAAREFLTFHETVRPDIIVGAEPYEAGVAALWIGRAFDRPVQIHVPDDFTAEAFRDRSPHNKWRVRMARYVLKRVASVRTKTDAIKQSLAARFKRLDDIEVLPRFYNFTGYLTAQPTADIHDTYRDFVFIILAFGPLTADSHLHETFTALNRVLHNPRIGLVVVGDGPARELFDEKVKLLGIERNVVFLKTLEDPISYVKTADLVFLTGTDRASEEHAMRAAAAGTPLIAATTDLLEDLFNDGESAFLCPQGDPTCFAQKFTKLLNMPALRKQFARNSQQVTRDRLIEDPNSYYRAYRDSIEVVLAGEEPPSAATAPEQPTNDQ